MLAQRLRHQVTIERRLTTLNGYREGTAAWSTFVTCWAAIEPTSGRELVASGASVSELTVRIIVRHDDANGVTAGMRVVLGGVYYDIASVINEGTRDRMLSLMCRAGANQGGA